MRIHQQKLIQLITETPSYKEADLSVVFSQYKPQELAHLFADVTFLISVFKFIQEQHWIEKSKKASDVIFSEFVKKFFKEELSPVLFFHASLSETSIDKMDSYKSIAENIQKSVLDFAKTFKFPDNKIFAEQTMKLMSELFEFEYQLTLSKNEKGLSLGYSLYRAFDIIDSFFNFEYSTEDDIEKTNPNQERLYQGSGSAVQSSYTTILLALRYLKMNKGSRFIDLGSGFGRVGLVLGLLRPYIQFTGYEFVQKRVETADHASQALNMSSHVHFQSQDLSAKDFSIPEADIYYLYDPFNEETYAHVISQLSLIAKNKKVTIITKGNAKDHFMNSSAKGIWSKPQVFEHGNFCLFRS